MKSQDENPPPDPDRPAGQRPLDSEIAISKDAPPTADEIEEDDSFTKVFEHGRHMGF